MEITGEHVLPASRDIVWKMLNDTDVLHASIPGCETLERLGPERMSAVVAVKIGPIKARFAGEVELVDLNPPANYAIVGEGKGGVAGFAKGRADIALKELAPTETLLEYTVNVAIGGKIAQLGGRLITSTSKKLSDQFFTAFAEQVPQFTAAQKADQA